MGVPSGTEILRSASQVRQYRDPTNVLVVRSHTMQLSGQTCSQTPAVCDAQGCGTTGPYGLAEFNLATTGVDFYDVSIISGVAVPVSITPQIVDSSNTNPASPYTCGNPGRSHGYTVVLPKF
jgi:hypothetical protein